MTDDRPAESELQDLLEAVASLGPDSVDTSGTVPCWVPRTVTKSGSSVRPDVVMALVGDVLLGSGLWPGPFDETADGRLYHFNTAPVE